MTQIISLCAWQEFQHYKDRDPPWIKLYRDILTTESWLLGTDLSRLVQVASMLLAVRYKNKIPLNWPLLQKVTNLDCSEQEFVSALRHLEGTRFLKVEGEQQVEPNGGGQPEQPDSTLLATCSSDARLKIRSEQSRAEQSRADPSASATPKHIRVPRDVSDAPAEWMLDFKLVYPNRSGDQGWRKAARAANARLAEGHTTAEFVAGAKRYGTFCDASGKTGTEFVKQACTFLGPDKHFLLPWHPPPRTETASERVLKALDRQDNRVIEHEPQSRTIAR